MDMGCDGSVSWGSIRFRGISQKRDPLPAYWEFSMGWVNSSFTLQMKVFNCFEV